MKEIIKLIPVEVYSRVVGYFRPVNQWNKGKQAEFKNRKEYKAQAILDELFFNEECLECFNPVNMCPDELRNKCYEEWRIKHESETNQTLPQDNAENGRPD